MLYPEEFGADPLFPSQDDFEIIEVDPLIGSGVKSLKKFEKGEVIAKMAGYVIADIRQHTLQIDSEHHNYDPYFSGYFLHSCAPNISLNMKDMTVIALQDITAGSLLYMDYAETEDYLFKQFPCSCAAKNCRGWITGALELPSNKPIVTDSAADLNYQHNDYEQENELLTPQTIRAAL